MTDLEMSYIKRKLRSLRCKNCDAILVGIIYAVAHIDIVNAREK